MRPKQRTLSLMGFDRFAKTTRRAAFLAQMEQVVPWKELCAVVEAHYPRGGRGRPPVGLERMLRIYFLQRWFNLSDPAVEEALYDSAAMRGFVGIDLGREPAPDETTVCKFRHLLEKHQLGEALFEQVHRHLEAQGIRISRGTIVDATIIDGPAQSRRNLHRVDYAALCARLISRSLKACHATKRRNNTRSRRNTLTSRSHGWSPAKDPEKNPRHPRSSA